MNNVATVTKRAIVENLADLLQSVLCLVGVVPLDILFLQVNSIIMFASNNKVQFTLTG